MTGLVERAFTWPVVNVDNPVEYTGVNVSTEGGLHYGTNVYGVGARYNPMVITQALVWAKSLDSAEDSELLTSFDSENPDSGWARFPRTESYFIKRWRGVARLSIVDVPEELSVEVPVFDPDDFAYTNSDGTTTQVDGVQSRVDLVFIYSKPVDSSSVTILKSSGKQVITTPQLGIVQGAGIRANFKESAETNRDYLSDVGDNHKILASPGDQNNTNLGFTAASGNDILQDVRGSFPAPDDILNLAPLISEKLEENAYELIGQSIMPVAYVWVQNGSPLVLTSDVIDIRPFFRTAELAYNERAGIAAAFPQLSLANPAVGKSQLDREIQKTYGGLDGRLSVLEEGQGSVIQQNLTTVATGYVFGGWNFGPEGALYNAGQVVNDNDAQLKEDIRADYAYASENAAHVQIPNYPDWDLANWCGVQDLDVSSKGLYPNDRINSYFGNNFVNQAGSNSELTNNDGTNEDGLQPSVLTSLPSMFTGNIPTSFHYISKRISFVRPSWLADYQVDCQFINSIPMTTPGGGGPASFTGWWVEKEPDAFTIYVAFAGIQKTSTSLGEDPYGLTPVVSTFPAPFQRTVTTGNKKKKKTSVVTVSNRSGGRFSNFLVPVNSFLYSSDDPYGTAPGNGYLGNPRMGICTYPTMMYSIRAIPTNAADYLYGSIPSIAPGVDAEQPQAITFQSS